MGNYLDHEKYCDACKCNVSGGCNTFLPGCVYIGINQRKDKPMAGYETGSMANAYEKEAPTLVPQFSTVKHPVHYTGPVPSVECIEVTQHFNFNKGSAIKYIWRSGHKNDEVEDLKKAIQFLEFEIARISGISSVHP